MITPTQISSFSCTPIRGFGSPRVPAINLFHKLFSYIREDVRYAADVRIDVRHLKGEKLFEGLEEIPKSVQLNDLIPLFKEINFHYPAVPGYMSVGARTDESYIFSESALLRSLEGFIKRVEDKKAFIGTPPNGTPESDRFFKRVEDVARLGIYKITGKYDAFMKGRNGTEPAMGDADYQTYQDLLQERARFVIDLSIAGSHCGAQYMSTSIEWYQTFRKEGRRETGSLQEYLLRFLSDEREKIADEQARDFIMSVKGGLQETNTTHALAGYMTELGSSLGLPGTEDCVEDWRDFIPIPKKKLLRKFFRTYTPDFIKSKIQQEVCRSQKLREEIVDRLKEQAGSWKTAEYEKKTDDVFRKISAVEKTENSSFLERFSLWREYLLHLQAAKSLPVDLSIGWQDFVSETLSSDAGKAFFRENEKDRNAFFVRKELEKALTTPQLALTYEKITRDVLEGRDACLTQLRDKVDLLERSKNINRVVLSEGFTRIAEEPLMRSLEGNADLRDVLKNHLDRARKEAFVADLQPFETSDEFSSITGLRPDILKWILVDAGILTGRVEKLTE